jgi:regulator of sigma E protease
VQEQFQKVGFLLLISLTLLALFNDLQRYFSP